MQRSDHPPNQPTPAPTLANASICPECGALVINGQYVCRPKYAPASA
ncbi:hypothetical protein [Streptomyces sp. CA-111067]